MSPENAITIVNEAIEAHGGLDLWNKTAEIEAVISASGFLFTAKRRPVLDRVRMRAFAHEPRFVMFNFPRRGQTSELIGNDEVRILDAGGDVMSRRVSPRSAFKGLRRQFFWDDLDFIYFCSYATWNYLTTPFLLAREGLRVELLGTAGEGLEQTHRIRVVFPDDIPTHCREQIYYFGKDGLLRRLDYTADVVGGWAHAAHYCGDYQTFGGIRIPTQRKVVPTFFGSRPLPGPTLVQIQVHDARLIPRSPA